MCKFRISAHDLEIEKGSYYKVDGDKRICKLCNIEVEDNIHDSDIHFLLKCPKLGDILNKIYSKYKNLSGYPFILRNISNLLIVLFAQKSISLQHAAVP